MQPVVDTLLPAAPPARLYLATVVHYLPFIRREGLYRGAQTLLDMYEQPEQALAETRTSGKPIVLIVKAQEMYRIGHAFYRLATHGQWRTERIPPQFLAVRR